MNEKYLQMLQTYVVPYWSAALLNINHPCQINSSMCFHTDGSGSLYTLVRDFPNETFINRGIERHGQIEWRGPDLTPLDLLVWDHLNSKVCINGPTNLINPKERIRTKI